MTVKLTRVAVKTRKVRALLATEPVLDELGRRALAVADQAEGAGIRVEGVPGRVDLPVTVTLTTGGGRARARVILDHPSGIAVEAKHGLLASSIDAGRA